MCKVSTVLETRTISEAPFRLSYQLLYTADVGMYGIRCTRQSQNGSVFPAYEHPFVTEDRAMALRLFALLADEVVFPEHVGDVLADVAGILPPPEVLPAG